MGRIILYMKWKIKNVPNHQPGWGYYSQLNGQMDFTTQKMLDKWWNYHQFQIGKQQKTVYHAKMKDICYKL